jgi:hypothetical protein
MRALNILFGLVGVAGGFFTLLAGVPVLVSLGAGGAVVVGAIAAGVASEFVGVQTLLTGLLGSDDDQFRL